MRTIKFSEEELELLLNLYQDELEMAENHVERIKASLSKLKSPISDTEEVEKEKAPYTGKKRGPKPKAKAAESKAPKKRGRPKKASVVPESSDDLIVADRKKPGRPKKASVAKKSSDDVIEAKRKKPGRPKKASVAPMINESAFKTEPSERGPNILLTPQKKEKALKKRRKKRRSTGGRVFLPSLRKPLRLPTHEPESIMAPTIKELQEEEITKSLMEESKE